MPVKCFVTQLIATRDAGLRLQSLPMSMIIRNNTCWSWSWLRFSTRLQTQLQPSEIISQPYGNIFISSRNSLIGTDKNQKKSLRISETLLIWNTRPDSMVSYIHTDGKTERKQFLCFYRAPYLTDKKRLNCMSFEVFYCQWSFKAQLRHSSLCIENSARAENTCQSSLRSIGCWNQLKRFAVIEETTMSLYA